MQEASQELKKLLRDIYDPRESSNIAEWVMEDLTGINHIDRIMHTHRILTEEQLDHYHEYILRLSNGMPVQYVIGYGYFMGLRFRVNEDVLIPRPETEELVQWAIDDKPAPHAGNSLTILDVGTGSGCIPIMLKKKIPTAIVHTIDISKDAIAVAKDNASIHETEIDFHQGNFLDPATWEALPETDVIISNPPYIPLRDKDTLNRNVLNFEPHLAIFVDNSDPLIFYRSIAAFAQTRLSKNGCIFVELDEGQAGDLKKLMKKSGFLPELRKDMQGRDRMMKMIWN
jgi:release factor glutamine methyltransferase